MFETREGKNVPQVTFRTRQDHEWIDVSTDDIFKGKTVVVFALPGAFTPTCSSTHVPRYNQLTPALKKHGVDDVTLFICTRHFSSHLNDTKLDQDMVQGWVLMAFDDYSEKASVCAPLVVATQEKWMPTDMLRGSERVSRRYYFWFFGYVAKLPFERELEGSQVTATDYEDLKDLISSTR